MEIALLAVYAALIFRTGFAAQKHTAAAFFVNNREAGALGVGFSIVVSCVGASATLGAIGMAFAVGTPAFWWLGAGAVGLVVLSLFLAGAVRQSGAYTLPHMVEAFLGSSARPPIAVVIVFAWSAILAAQFSALAGVLEPLTGFTPLACLGLGFILVCGHSLGGQSAIMRVDKIQALIILLALAVILAWLTWRNSTWAAQVEFQLINKGFPPEKLLYFLVIVGANYMVCPMLFGRMLSAKNAKSARFGGLVGAAGILVCSGLIVAVGLACKGLIPAGTPQDAVLTTILAETMPRWLQSVVSFALISAIVSSADSCLVTAATVCSYDLLGRQDVASGRRCILGLGLSGALVSLWGKGILGFLLMAYDIFACGVVMPVFVGLLLRRRQMDSRWARAAVAVGGLFGLASAVIRETACSYLGLAASSILALGGAYAGCEREGRQAKTRERALARAGKGGGVKNKPAFPLAD